MFKINITHRILTLAVLILLIPYNSAAQKYKLANSKITFISSTPLEKIEGNNKTTAGIIDSETNKFTVRVKILDFLFDSELQQDHFNENYMESEKFPNSTYKGDIVGNYNLTNDGTYNLISKGDLTIHGITKTVEIPATIIVKGNSITLSSKFAIKLADYKIEIPSIVAEKIAETINIQITSELIPF